MWINTVNYASFSSRSFLLLVVGFRFICLWTDLPMFTLLPYAALLLSPSNLSCPLSLFEFSPDLMLLKRQLTVFALSLLYQFRLIWQDKKKKIILSFHSIFFLPFFCISGVGAAQWASFSIQTHPSIYVPSSVITITIQQVMYGMTETSPVTFQCFPSDPPEVRSSTIGYPSDHVEVKLNTLL